MIYDRQTFWCFLHVVIYKKYIMQLLRTSVAGFFLKNLLMLIQVTWQFIVDLCLGSICFITARYLFLLGRPYVVTRSVTFLLSFSTLFIFIILYFPFLWNRTVDQDQNWGKEDPYWEELRPGFSEIHLGVLNGWTGTFYRIHNWWLGQLAVMDQDILTWWC